MDGYCFQRVDGVSMGINGVHPCPSAGRCRRRLGSKATAQKSRGMTRARAITGVAAATLLLVAVTSCAADPAAPATSGSPTPTPSAAETATVPTTSATSETESASESASALLTAYFATVDQLRQQPDQPLSGLDTVAISTQLAAQKKLIQSQRTSGLRQTGSTTIAKLTVQSVNLDDSDPQAGKVPTVQIDVCYDVSAVDVLDGDGTSVVGADRPDTGWVRFTVSNYTWEADPTGGWRVASGADLKQAPCAAS